MAKKKNILAVGDRVEIPVLIPGKDGKHARSVRFGRVAALDSQVAVMVEGEVNAWAIPMNEVIKHPG